jgi:hypothetical protein
MSRTTHHHHPAESQAADVLFPLIRAAATIGFAIAPCSLGFVIIAVSEQIIRSIMVGDDPEQLVSELQNQFPHAVIEAADQAKGLVANVVDSIERSNPVHETLDGAPGVIDLSHSYAKVTSLSTSENVCVPETQSFPSITASFGQSTKAQSSPSSTP